MGADPDITLRTRRLHIRELTLKDVPDIARELANPLHRRFVLPLQNGDAYVDSIVAEALMSARHEPRLIYRLVIECLESAQYLGYCTLHLRLRPRTANLGFEIAKPASGRGVATEAARALVDFAFNKLRVEQIFADMDERNAACRKTLEKVGFSPVRLWPWHRYSMRRKYRTHLDYMRVGLSRAHWREQRNAPAI